MPLEADRLLPIRAAFFADLSPASSVVERLEPKPTTFATRFALVPTSPAASRIDVACFFGSIDDNAAGLLPEIDGASRTGSLAVHAVFAASPAVEAASSMTFTAGGQDRIFRPRS